MSGADYPISPEVAALLGRAPEDPDAAAEAERIAEEKRALRQVLLARLMGAEDFRDWLWEMLVRVGTFAYPLEATVTGFPHPEATQFWLGRKSAGEEFWRAVDDAAPDLASQMRREHMQKPKEVRALPPQPAPPPPTPKRAERPARLVGEGLPGEEDDGS